MRNHAMLTKLFTVCLAAGLGGLAETAQAQDARTLTTTSPSTNPSQSEAQQAPTGLASTLVASGFSRPTTIAHVPGDETRLFVTERSGHIRIVDLEAGQVLSTPFLDISDKVNVGSQFGDERGLLGLAFHPDYEDNGHFYVNYIGGFGSGSTVVERYTVSSDPNLADEDSDLTLLTFNQPFSNHNGGWIDFGPDGFLYIATGDGGSGGDPQNNSQNTNNFLGNMLRIDVDNPDGGMNYGIPEDNPFKGVSGALDEIWSYGLRNPWRNSFDRQTGELFIADVGQNAWEEINKQTTGSPGGQNWGWRCYEGFKPFNTGGCPPPSELEFPIYAYPISGQSECSITGGYVYRGCDIPDLQGQYIFGDFCSSEIWAMDPRDSNLPFDPSQGGTDPAESIRSQLSPSVEGLNINNISAFGEDARGEVYIVDFAFGRIFKIIHEDGPQPTPDLNCDGVVDTQDLFILLSNWGECSDPDNCPGDLDQNGAVDTEDLFLLLSEWG